jgi:Tfp pilus assembly protein PilN
VKSASAAGRRGTLAPGAKPGVQPAAIKVLPPKFEHYLELVGMAQSNELIADYVGSLRRSPLFSSVDVSEIVLKDIDDKAFRKFTITMKLAEQVEFDAISGAVETTLIDGFDSASVMTGDE